MELINLGKYSLENEVIIIIMLVHILRGGRYFNLNVHIRGQPFSKWEYLVNMKNIIPSIYVNLQQNIFKFMKDVPIFSKKKKKITSGLPDTILEGNYLEKLILECHMSVGSLSSSG